MAWWNPFSWLADDPATVEVLETPRPEEDPFVRIQKWTTALIQAEESVNGAALVDRSAVKVDVDAALTSARNVALAGDGEKARLLGTLSTEPEVSLEELAAAGFSDEAARALLERANKARQAALGLI